MLFQAQPRKSLTILSLIGLALGCGQATSEPEPISSNNIDQTQLPALGEPGTAPTLAGCPVLPPSDEWNRRVDTDPVDPRSDQYMAGMNGGSRSVHPDFGGAGEYGIPFVVVPGNQPRVPMEFDYADESDPGPYPIPADAPMESGSDHHILVLDRDTCLLYETWDTRRNGAGWLAGSGAVFDLRSGALRPDGWTSADAAGLPILPGLIRFDEVKAGRIDHALRFTVQRTQRAYVAPARHFASTSTDANLPPMGLRVRLKAGFDISAFGPTAKVVLTALKEYGMFLADNGGDWFITGEANPGWNDDEIAELSRIPASAFEAVAHGTLQK